MLTASLISVIGSLSLGQLFDKNSELVHKIIENTALFSKIAPKVLLADLIPITRPLLLRESWQRLQQFSNDLTSYILGKIAEHDRLDAGDDTVRDFQDAFDKVYADSDEAEMEKLKIVKSTVQNAGQDLFAAGFATITEHAHYGLKLLGSRPDLQAELRNQIEAVVKNGRKEVSLKDREQMPYVQSFIEEIFRHFSHAPLSLPHGTLEEVNFHGYLLPTDTVLLMNLHSVHYDPKTFENPEEFQPNRFVNAKGEFDGPKAEKVIPFGYGKRKCVGEVVARRVLFLVITNLVKNYDIRLTSFEGKTPLATTFGFTLQSNAANFIFEPLATNINQ